MSVPTNASTRSYFVTGDHCSLASAVRWETLSVGQDREIGGSELHKRALSSGSIESSRQLA